MQRDAVHYITKTKMMLTCNAFRANSIQNLFSGVLDWLAL